MNIINRIIITLFLFLLNRSEEKKELDLEMMYGNWIMVAYKNDWMIGWPKNCEMFFFEDFAKITPFEIIYTCNDYSLNFHSKKGIKEGEFELWSTNKIISSLYNMTCRVIETDYLIYLVVTCYLKIKFLTIKTGGFVFLKSEKYKLTDALKGIEKMKKYIEIDESKISYNLKFNNKKNKNKSK